MTESASPFNSSSSSNAKDKLAAERTSGLVPLFFGAGFVVALISAGAFFLSSNETNEATYILLGISCLFVSVVFAVCGFFVQSAKIGPSVLAASWSSIILLCLITVGMNEGIHALSLGFFGVLITIVTILAGFGAGVAMAMFCCTWIGLLAAAEYLGYVGGAAVVPSSPFGLRVITLFLLMGTALSVGMLVARVIQLNLESIRIRDEEQRAILRNAPLGIALTRAQRFTQVNEACESIFGYSEGSMSGRRVDDFWRAHGAEALASTSSQARGSQFTDIVYELNRLDGSTFWCRLRGQPVTNDKDDDADTVWVFEDVTERQRMEQALAASRDSAEAASRAKSMFLANTSHEIRTPLNGIIGLARLASQPRTSQEAREKYLNQVIESAQNLAAVMGGILDMSKIESGKLTIEEAPFDLHALLANLHNTYTTIAAAKGIGFRLELDTGLPTRVIGDAVRLRQIVSNYITNALKFTEQGHVRVRAQLSGVGVIKITVIDTGIGIKEDIRAQLFQPFTQADASTTRKYGGTGLGLSICRELATLMHGGVGAESAPGFGSRFWVELPLPSIEEHPSAEPVKWGTNHLPPSTGSTADINHRQPFLGRRVLVAEDNPVNMIITVAMLEDWGVEVVRATDGREAIAALEAAEQQDQRIELVLMDIQMPILDGFSATRELRKQFSSERLPIIALTAGVLTEERDEARACGMNDFIPKPIDEHLLEVILSNYLRSAGNTLDDLSSVLPKLSLHGESRTVPRL